VRIAITGASGKLGTATVTALRDAGHEVLSIDRTGGRGSGVVVTELSDYGQVIDLLLGGARPGERFDAIVHLGAIPAPGLVPDAETFRNNITSTFNVLHAARQAGIRRIVTASSETVLGLPFDEAPPYLPIDEQTPLKPESVYSLVKRLEEELAKEFVRWDPELSISALRFSNVISPEEYAGFPAFDADPALRKWNLWTYIDVRDGARAVLRAVENGVPGFEAYVIANPDSVMSRSTPSLAAEVFPGVPFRSDVDGTGSLYSIEKARRVLGFDPQHTWRA
jgi:nucleoside-diphosphate-sugar epimerase